MWVTVPAPRRCFRAVGLRLPPRTFGWMSTPLSPLAWACEDDQAVARSRVRFVLVRVVSPR